MTKPALLSAKRMLTDSNPYSVTYSANASMVLRVTVDNAKDAGALADCRKTESSILVAFSGVVTLTKPWFVTVDELFDSAELTASFAVC